MDAMMTDAFIGMQAHVTYINQTVLPLTYTHENRFRSSTRNGRCTQEQDASGMHFFALNFSEILIFFFQNCFNK